MEAESFKILESHVRRAWDTGNHHEQWRNRPEIPDKAEIMPLEEEDSGLRNNRNRNREEGWNEYQKDPIYNPKLPKNIVNGPWPSKEEYISAHYQILREDAIAPLRESVKYFRAHRNMDDDSSTCVYTHVSASISHLNSF
jgi:helicase required for RNAi-mediated heterochromatin assembly 1